MTDHNFELSSRRIDDGIKHGNEALKLKKDELTAIEAEIKALKTKEPLLEREIAILESNQRTKIGELDRMVRQHQSDLAKIQTGKPGVNVPKMPPHRYP